MNSQSDDDPPTSLTDNEIRSYMDEVTEEIKKIKR